MTILVPTGMLRSIQSRATSARVVAGEHEVVVDAEHEALGEQERGERREQHARPQARGASATTAHAASRHRIG